MPMSELAYVDQGKDRISLDFEPLFDRIRDNPHVVGSTISTTLSDLFNNLNANPGPFLRSELGGVLEINNVSPSPKEIRMGGVATTSISQADVNLPEFLWEIPEGAVAGRQMLNRFEVLIFNGNFSTVLLQSPILTLADVTIVARNLLLGRDVVKWTPSATDWAQVTATVGTKHFVIRGARETTQLNGLFLPLASPIYNYTSGFYRSDPFDFQIVP